MTDFVDAPITWIVFTFNEAARIERVVRNLRASGPVLVVDNYSDDDTKVLAEALGAKVLLNKNPGWVEDENTARVVKEAVQTPWLYWGYADEMLSHNTISHLIDIVASDQHDVVSIGKRNYFYGSFCERAFAGGALPRLFRKDAIDFTDNIIHHFGRITVPDSRVYHVSPNTYFVHQFISHSTGTMLGNLDRYSDIEARRGKARHPFRIFIGIFKTFIVNYLMRGGYRAGREGFFYCLYNLVYDIFLGMRRFEVQRGYHRSSIEYLNNRWRDDILRDQEVARDSIASVSGVMPK